MSTCQGCGTPIPPSHRARPRKWCSDRCRKTLYQGTCLDCGGSTNGHEGRGPNAPKRCRQCDYTHKAADRRDAALARARRFRDLRASGLSNGQIADREGCKPYVVANALSRLKRKYGEFVPRDAYFTDRQAA